MITVSKMIQNVDIFDYFKRFAFDYIQKNIKVLYFFLLYN